MDIERRITADADLYGREWRVDSWTTLLRFTGKGVDGTADATDNSGWRATGAHVVCRVG